MDKDLIPGRAVVVTGTSPDRVNNNTDIRRFAANALRHILPHTSILEVNLAAAPVIIAKSRPVLIVAIGSLAIAGDELRSLRKAADGVGAPLAFWLHDDPYEFDYSYRAETYADVIFTNDAWARHHYRHKYVYHLPLAACRETYLRPLHTVERDTEVFFCGHAHPNRITLLRDAANILQNYSFVLSGTGWPSDLLDQKDDRKLPAEIADWAQRSMTTLNLPRSYNVANRRFDLPASTPGPRTFEIALAGSAQLVWAPGLEIDDYFSRYTEFVVFDGPSDLLQLLRRMRDDPSYFEGIAEAAQTRALKDHCYENRMTVLIEKACPNLQTSSATDRTQQAILVNQGGPGTEVKHGARKKAK
jgi:spore maturation protein CgeB